jgi:hypothetical protein
MRRTTPLCLLAVVVFASPSIADTVRLKNGRAYEDVIAERTPQGVRVQLAFGQIILPNDQVVAIEKGESVVEAYLARKATLESANAGAADWLLLAQWAKMRDLSSAARQAAVKAAELDPRLPGLDAMLRPHGLVFEEALARWIPFEESMARRGLVRYEGEWISVEEQRERIAERQRRRAVEAQEEASRRLAAAAEEMRRTQEQIALERQRAMENAYYDSGYWPTWWGFPGFFFPPVVGHPNGHGHRHRTPGSPMPPIVSPEPRHSFGRLQRRQPGTFLPLDDPSFNPPAMSSGGGGGG